jgi:hypothetical protein
VGPRRPHHEGDAEGDGGQGVGEVVDGVAQQGHRSADEHDDELEGGGERQPAEGGLQRPDPVGAGGQGRVDRLGCVVAVGGEHAAEEAAQPGPSVAAVPVVAVLVVARRVVAAVLVDLASMVAGRVVGHAGSPVAAARRGDGDESWSGMSPTTWSAWNSASSTMHRTWSLRAR